MILLHRVHQVWCSRASEIAGSNEDLFYLAHILRWKHYFKQTAERSANYTVQVASTMFLRFLTSGGLRGTSLYLILQPTAKQMEIKPDIIP